MKTNITENDIRPDGLMSKQKEYIQQDIDFLISKKNNFINVNCPSCAISNTQIEFTKNSFEYIECKNCGMLYMSPRPSTKVLAEFYPNSPNYKFFNDYIFPNFIYLLPSLFSYIYISI